MMYLTPRSRVQLKLDSLGDKLPTYKGNLAKGAILLVLSLGCAVSVDSD